jgi:general secretion pathway protein D
MIVLRPTLAVFLALVLCSGAEGLRDRNASSCAPAANCKLSKKQVREAKEAFSEALKLRDATRLDEALHEFDVAVNIAPRNLDYVRERELTRQQIVFGHMQRGNAALSKQDGNAAIEEFKEALLIDPHNQFAQQQLRSAASGSEPKKIAGPVLLADAEELRLAPNRETKEFHFRGDSRQMLTQVANAFGVTAVFDDSVVSRRVHFDLDKVDFDTAMSAAGRVTRSFWVPTDSKTVLILLDTPENHRLFDQMVLRTFVVPGVTAPNDLNDILNLLRNLFDIRLMTPQPNSSTIVVRAPQRTMDAATKFMESLDSSRPQVMLEVKVYEVSHTFTRNIGLSIPNQFTLFNIPAAALAALGGLDTSSISALIAQLQSQQNSIFNQPLATFGGGLTLEGLTLGTLSAQLALNESWVRTLEKATLRIGQGSDATFHLGTRYPIVTSQYSSGFDTSSISQLAQSNPTVAQALQSNSFSVPAPSINYEDLGLNLKAKPNISSNSDVSLQLELQFRALGGTSVNNVPIITNREYKGSINLRDGEPAVVAGQVSRSDIRSLSGIPALSAVPLLNNVASSNSKQEDTDELLIVVTPHVISNRTHDQASQIWLTR